MATAVERETTRVTGAWVTSVVAAVRYALPALAAYAAVRAVGILLLFVWTQAIDQSFTHRLARGDAGAYIRIATQGYQSGTEVRSNLAFFPLYPRLISWLDPILPAGPRAAALLIAWVAALAAAWGIFAVGDLVGGKRVGVLLAALWGVIPHAVVQNMPYTEGLFTALAAWSLYAVLRQRWLTAAGLCLLAGLTRPTATALIPAVALAALVAIVRRRDGWRPYVALVVAPLGWLAYIAWVGWRTGSPLGWFHVQRDRWGMSFDGGLSTVDDAARVLAQESAFELMLVTLTLVVAVALFALSILDRQPWPLLVYSGLLLAAAIGSAGFYNARARFLLPGFALLLPAATSLARTRSSRAWVVVGTLAVISAYIGCYLILIWRASP